MSQPTSRHWCAKKILPTIVAAGALTSPAFAADGDLYITEVMANTVSGQNSTDEYIELFNNGDAPISIEGMRFTDGDSTDTIVAWNQGSSGSPAPGMVLDSLIIPPGKAAVILDPNYLAGTRPYGFAHQTVILTVMNSSLGNGLSADDPITLYGPDGTTAADVIDTYGTPVDAESPSDRDDDGADAIPLSPNEGLTAQRFEVPGPDSEENWWIGPPSPGYRPMSGELHVAADESYDYTTIYDALGSVGPGATIIVHPGDYTDDLRIYIPLTITAAEGAEATFIDGTVTVEGAAGEVTLEGFTFAKQVTALDTTLNVQDSHLAGAGIFFNSSGGNVEGCLIEGASFGVHLDQGSSPDIGFTTISDTSNAAIYAFGGSSPTVHDCTLNGGEGFGIQSTADPMISGNRIVGYDTGVSLGSEAGTVAHNIIINNRDVGIRINNNRYGWVHANTLRDNSLGMDITYSASWITDNIVSRSGSHGISIASGFGFIDDDIFAEVRGNTIVESDEDGIFLDFADITVRGNIVMSSGRYGINDSNSRIRIGANNLFENSSGGYASGLEGDDDVLADPQFTDFDGADYRLLPGSPCIDRGENRDDYTDGTDALGNPRQVDGNGDGIVLADIGAVEFIPPCPDADADGFEDASCGGEDCDDSDPVTFPGAIELVDGVDNDCDGEIDEDDSCTGGCCGTDSLVGEAPGVPAGLPAGLLMALALSLGFRRRQ